MVSFNVDAVRGARRTARGEKKPEPCAVYLSFDYSIVRTFQAITL